MWDSHPLALGATPQQVWIDGIPQIAKPHVVPKSDAFQHTPETPNFDKEAGDALKFEGLPPLLPQRSNRHTVVFTNVSEVFVRKDADIQEVLTTQSGPVGVVVSGGRMICSGTLHACDHALVGNVEYIDLQGGSITPGLVSFGSPLGLEEIGGEISTSDGVILDPLLIEIPELAGGGRRVIRAADGLQYTTRDAL